MMSGEFIPFNIPYQTGREAAAMQAVMDDGILHGGGPSALKCETFFKETFQAKGAFMTPSCSMAMDMAAIVLGFKPGDEVLVPDYTFVTTAQSIALRGATPVLCDIDSKTLNLDVGRLEAALTPRTKAVMPMHYAGVSVDMDPLCAFAKAHNLYIIEDAAQAVGARYKNKPVGTYGDMSAFSFHATKNIQCGEGGMLVVNSEDFEAKCAVVQEKGTDRRAFIEGHVAKYQWVDLGSSFLSNEITAAYLYTQLLELDAITQARRTRWLNYDAAFKDTLPTKNVQTPHIPNGCEHNAHMYYLILPSQDTRKAYMNFMHECGVQTVFHYTPLHQSQGGKLYCREGMDLNISSDLPHRLVRLPLYPTLSQDAQERIISATHDFCRQM